MTIDELKQNNLILFECLSGSRAYGLDTPQSDTDIKGVFYLPREQFLGLGYIEQINNASNDIVYYKLGRFVELLLKNNPCALELLASPAECILYAHPLMAQLKLSDFLSKLAKETFAGYAMTQIKKSRGLNKKIHNPVPKERKSILDFCYILQGQSSVSLLSWLAQHQYQSERCGLTNIAHMKDIYGLYYDINDQFQYNGLIKNGQVSSLNLSSIPKTEQMIAYLYYNKDGYSSYCKEYHSYWQWVENRNEARYQGNRQSGADYDAKNMMHTIRLLQTAQEIVTRQSLSVRCNNREELLAIKTGQFGYETMLLKAEQLMQEIDQQFLSCALQDKPDRKKINTILVNIRKSLYHCQD